MNFLYPTFLYALVLIAIPIIIHLFHFRRYKKVYFTNVRFLKTVKKETTSRNKIKHLLILLSRILAVSFLVFAFTQPFIPNDTGINSQTKSNIISIYIDNSFSMESTQNGESLLALGKKKAKEIISAYPNDSKFQLITNKLSGKEQRLLAKENLINELDKLNIIPYVRSFDRIFAKQKQAFEKASDAKNDAYLISDFQKSVFDFTRVKKDSNINYFLIPLEADKQMQNIYIDSCWLEKPYLLPQQSNKLLVQIRSFGNNINQEGQITLKLDGVIKAINKFDLSVSDNTIDTLAFTLSNFGWHEAIVSINDYPITFDDKYYMSIYVPKKLNVLIINQDVPSLFLNALYQNQKFITVQNNNIGNINFNELKQQQLIILNNLTTISSGLQSAIKEFVSKGGDVVIIPSIKADLFTYNKLLSALNSPELIGQNEKQQNLENINTKQALYADIFESIPKNINLPWVKNTFVLSKQNKAEHLLSFADKQPFLVKSKLETGNCYFFAGSFEKEHSNFTSHSIFAPTFYKMAISSLKIRPVNIILGGTNTLFVANTTSSEKGVLHIKNEETDFIPAQRIAQSASILSFYENLQTAGIYNISEAESQIILSKMAVNYDRKESNAASHTLAELQAISTSLDYKLISDVQENLTLSVKELSRGTPLWKVCIIFVLIFLIIEVLLLRFWK